MNDTKNEFGERLVFLSDGRPGLRSGVQIEVQEPAAVASPSAASDQSSTASILDFIASDETLDRSDEVINASGWRLESYRRNPVFQNAHQYGDIIFTLGRALITEVRMAAGRPALFQRVQFATEANPMARIAYALYKGKFLNAVSVGFIPLRWENPNEDARSRSSSSFSSSSCSIPFFPRHNKDRGRERAREGGGGWTRRYLEQELLEVSAVGIPANPNALQLGLKAGVIQKSDLKELAELVRSLAGSNAVSPALHDSITPCPPFRSNPAAPDSHTGALGVRGYEAQLLRLAREVGNVMRHMK